MEITPQLIGQFAGVLLLVAALPYFVDIFRGNTKPSRAAYAIWLAINLITLTSYVASGAQATSWIFLASTISTILIFILSLKYGMGGFNRLDIVCMGLAMLAIALWVTTKNPVTALYTSLTAYIIGYVPIIKKSYLQPDTENTLSWGVTAIASILNLFALTSLVPSLVIPPLSVAILDPFIAGLLIFPRARPVGMSSRILKP